MNRTLLAAAAVVIGITAVAAQSDPIAQRKEIMKGVGAQTKTGAAMAKGEAPFDQAKATQIFTTYEDAAAKMPNLFPANSKSGGETTAAAKIWEDMDGFKKGFTEFGADAKAAKGNVKDLDSFKANFGNVTKNCGGCHETYRVKKS
ncbi:MAG: cytochrome c [Xanthobacteraceae bacterium]|nr:cytochrome c [Xanthobacteraceae bacterium]PWB60147.1 MAG: cytochrome C [Bradyrhizobiaceae bacterium]